MEDSESAKQKTTEWQPGSDQAQFGITSSNKFFLLTKFLWEQVNSQIWHRCQH
ncbi:MULTISPECIES: hypothetical protein [Nostocales]|uniref:hypothetical protein n=1 Tax=Nostocales TaxID=1161 RepID=UPI001687B11D|nr:MULTISPECIES: hypothetical protein [Nostocales]MBD2478623.1 hypothetical protein [Anabaena sp. FACHB-83]MBD2487820.1 hypothetical protein [Aulosira sp. FACHB-615]